MAHHDIKPENIFVTENNLFKLGVLMFLFFDYFIGDFGNVELFKKTVEGKKFFGTWFVLIIIKKYILLGNTWHQNQ
jgi:serine/threonine protein kinase